jgi:hypothetical protein
MVFVKGQLFSTVLVSKLCKIRCTKFQVDHAALIIRAEVRKVGKYLVYIRTGHGNQPIRARDEEGRDAVTFMSLAVISQFQGPIPDIKRVLPSLPQFNPGDGDGVVF